jgi:molybdopterin molybdotransferase
MCAAVTTIAAVGDLLSIAEARAVVASHVAPLGVHELPIADAGGRFLAEPVQAAHDVPAWPNSAMDGYAVTSGPKGRTLAVTGDARAGAPAETAVTAETAIRISTGAVLPEGADAVLQVELVSVDGDRVTLDDDVTAGRNVRRPGEDMRAGATVLEAGTRLGPAELGVAVTAGRAEVTVAYAPRVTVVATGDELVDPGVELRPGQIHDSNAVTLAWLARRAGADVRPPARAPDNREGTERALAKALEHADVVIVSGGVSVGPHDHVKPALQALGVEERFWRVALRPGKPTWFGTRDGQLVFGLPGNPVSSVVTFHLFVRPALLALQHAPFAAAPERTAYLTEAVARNPGRDEAVRVRLGTTPAGVLTATPTGPQGSHVLTSLLAADALALVTAGEGALQPGETVPVELLST